MSKEDLIPLGQVGNEEHDRAVRSKIIGSGSSRRKIAQKISHLYLSNPKRFEKRCYEIISSPQTSAYEILKLYGEILSQDLKPELKIQLLGKLIQAHQAIHGNKNLNVNFEANQSFFENIKNKKIILERVFWGLKMKEKRDEFVVKFGDEAGKWLDDLLYKLHIHILRVEEEELNWKTEKEYLKFWEDTKEKIKSTEVRT